MTTDQAKLTAEQMWAQQRPAAAALIRAYMDGDTATASRIMKRWAADPAQCVEFTMTVAILAGAIVTGAAGNDAARAAALLDTWIADAVTRRAAQVEAGNIAGGQQAA